MATALGTAAFAEALRRLLGAETGADERMHLALLAGALAWLLVTLSGRRGFGLFASAGLIGALWLASTLKRQYLHQPLLGPDLRYFLSSSTADVIAHYPGMWPKVLGAVVGGFVVAAWLWWIERPAGWRGRRLAHAAWSLLAAFLVAAAWPGASLGAKVGTGTWAFIEHATANPATTFLDSISRMRVSLPPHSATAASRFDWGEASAAQAEHRPDIVVVLEESTLDPRQWAACAAPQCSLPLFDGDASTRARGDLLVHTWGGATWTSEFAFLAALPHPLFGPAGIYAPYNLAPRVRYSLPRQLKALGYRSIAFYPMEGGFVRAAEAYADYGFDEFHDAAELGLGWESSDGDLVARFQERYPQLAGDPGQPLFIMLLTMRQHGPHDLPLDALPAPFDRPLLPGEDERTNRNVGHYLHRLHESAAALERLRAFLFASGRPTLLAHFGDHRPSFDGLERGLASSARVREPALARQLTYYRIDSTPAGERETVPDRLDLAFLAGLIIDIAGLPKDAFFEANTRLRERCNGRFMDCPQPEALESWMAHAFGRLDALGP